LRGYALAKQLERVSPDSLVSNFWGLDRFTGLLHRRAEFRFSVGCRAPTDPLTLNEIQVLAREAILGRSAELVLIGLKRDGSDLVLENLRVTSRVVADDALVDHPIDRATQFLYAQINVHHYRFAFDECNNLVHMTNRSGYDFGD